MPPLCRWYQEGRCRFGLKCRNPHTEEEAEVELTFGACLPVYRSFTSFYERNKYLCGLRLTKIIANERESNSWWSKDCLLCNMPYWNRFKSSAKHMGTRESLLLREEQYLVTPKADGVRVTLLSEKTTGKLFKVARAYSMESVVSLDHSSTIGGFIIDAEEVTLTSGEKLYVAFDLLAVNPRTLAYFGFSGKVTLLEIEHGCKAAVALESTKDRNLLMRAIVDECRTNIVVKPVWHASQAEDVWLESKRLPYHVDGLIFCPLQVHPLRHLRTLKWKPPDRLTFDVALGKAVESTETGSRFFVYLCHLEAPQSNGIPCGSQDEIRHAKHTEFALVSDEDGALQLVVGEGTPKLSVWVEGPDARWAAFSIAEVLFDRQRSELLYIGLRRDLNRANSIQQASDIVDIINVPVDLSTLTVCPDEQDTDNSQSVMCGRGSYRLPRSLCSRQYFVPMREMHKRIKGLLYELYAGKSIIDAGSGSLADLSSWIAAGVHYVLAVDIDDALVAQANERLRSYSAHTLTLSCEIKKLDLSKPQLIISGGKTAIFCNFALHYFWESEESTSTFLNNLVPMLVPGGFFVVTYMNGDSVDREKHIKILNESGAIEFEAKVVDEKSVDVFVASIGVQHREGLVFSRDLVERFENAGLDHVATQSFHELRSLFPSFETNMTSDEKRMSNLYVSSVFRKPVKSCTDHQRTVLPLPENTVLEILSFCDIPDLASLRGASSQFRGLVDFATNSSRIGKRELVIYKEDDTDFVEEVFRSTTRRDASLSATPAALATFLRLGGHLRVLPDSSDSSLSNGYAGFYNPFGYFDFINDYDSDSFSIWS